VHTLVSEKLDHNSLPEGNVVPLRLHAAHWQRQLVSHWGFWYPVLELKNECFKVGFLNPRPRACW
jgi:hypothetical protein